MPISVQGTQITFNDSTNQTTAFTGPFQVQVQYFTSGSTTWTAPAGVTRVKAIVVGGGGGASGWSGSRGGSGGYSSAYITVTPGTGYTATVGGPGTYQGGNSPPGGGGTSSFGSFLSATGGAGGNKDGANPTGNGSGTVSSGTAIATGNVFYDTNVNDGGVPNNAGISPVMGTPLRFGSQAAYSATARQAAGAEGTGGVVYLEWVAP